MTLIACISADAFPVLLADSLLSSSNGRDDMILPTVGVVNLPRVFGEYRPHGTAQKIVQISPTLTVAFAGCVETATKILESLARFLAHDPATTTFVRGLLDAEFTAEFRDRKVSLIAVVTGNGAFSVVPYNCVGYAVRGIGTVFAAGSGREALVTLLESILPSTVHIEQPYHRALATAVAVGSSLLSAEIISSGASLTQGFGGGYEYVIFPHGEAQRWTDYSCIFWEAKFSGENLRADPFKLIRGVLRDGVGGVFSAVFHPEKKLLEGDNPFLFRSPLSPGLDRAPWEVPELNAKLQVNLFANRENGVRVGALIVFRESAEGHLVTFRVNDQSLEIRIDPKSYDKVIREVVALAVGDGA